MALRGLRVVEMAGLAPAPLAGMILSGKIIIMLQTYTISIHLDFGASVIRVDKPNQSTLDTMARWPPYTVLP